MEYGENISDLVFSCYWCNNAKSNFFTSEEFEEIGKIIAEIIHKKLLT
jgi:hypothetical protein